MNDPWASVNRPMQILERVCNRPFCSSSGRAARDVTARLRNSIAVQATAQLAIGCCCWIRQTRHDEQMDAFQLCSESAIGHSLQYTLHRNTFTLLFTQLDFQLCSETVQPTYSSLLH